MCFFVQNCFYDSIFYGERGDSVGRVSDLGWKGCEFETLRRNCVLSMSKTLYQLLSILVQLRKTGNHPDMTEKSLTGT